MSGLSGVQKSWGFQSTIILHNGFCFWRYLQARACAYLYRSSHYPRYLSVCLWNLCGHHWVGERGMKAFFFSISPLCLYRKSTKSHVGRIPCIELMFDTLLPFLETGDDCLQPVTFRLKTTPVWRRGCLLAS